MAIAQWLLIVAGLYAGAGLLFGLIFVIRGVVAVDAAAHGSRWTFRLLIWPGAAMLWPILATRWMKVRRAGGQP